MFFSQSKKQFVLQYVPEFVFLMSYVGSCLSRPSMKGLSISKFLKQIYPLARGRLAKVYTFFGGFPSTLVFANANKKCSPGDGRGAPEPGTRFSEIQGMP